MTASYLNNGHVHREQGCDDSRVGVNDQWVNPDVMPDACMVKTAASSYCSARDFPEEILTQPGVTDPVSGPVITHKP